MSQATKFAQSTTKAVSLEDERTVRVVMTAPTLDRDLDVIDSKSIRIPTRPTGWKYAQDMLSTDTPDVGVFIDHDWRIEKQAGYVKSIYMNDSGELEAIVKLSTVDNGERVYTLAKEDALGNALSIGFSYQNATLEDGVTKNIELLELSFVFKGSNDRARVLEVKSAKGEKMAEATKSEKIEGLQKQIKALEDTEEVVATPVEATTEQVTETPTEPAVVETPAEEVKEEAKEEAPVEAPAETEAEETKSIKEETTQMSDIATKQVLPEAKAPEVDQPATKAVKMDKVDFAAKQFVAYLNKDTKTLSELNQIAIDSYSAETGTKAAYMNAGTAADGGNIVPSAELLRDVYSTLADYSTVANDLRVVTLTSGDSLDIATLVTDVIVKEVATEGGYKPATKPTLGKKNVALREFAGIAIVTKKLVRQAAVNVYDLLRESFARAIAEQRAKLALTDSTSGIGAIVGTVNVTATANTWADVRSMPYSIPASTVQGGKYYISRELLAELDQASDNTGRDLDVVELSGDGLSGRFKNGFNFAVEEVLGGSAPDAIFGAMGRFGILLRQGTVESETFDSGVVNDGGTTSNGTNHNLIQENKLAHRVAFYENVGYPLPGAFAKYTALPASS